MSVLNIADAMAAGSSAVDAVYLGATKVWPPVSSVYFDDTFSGSGTMDGTTTETGGLTWVKAGGVWTEDGLGDLRDTSTATHATLAADSGENDFSLVGDITFAKGSATGHWSGLFFLGSSQSAFSGLSVRPDGTAGAPTLKLFAGTATIIENWTITSILLDSTGARLTSGDRATLRIDYNATTWTIDVYLDDQLAGSHTLAGAEDPLDGDKATYGSNTWHGLYSNERINPGGTVWHSVSCLPRS